MKRKSVAILMFVVLVLSLAIPLPKTTVIAAATNTNWTSPSKGTDKLSNGATEYTNIKDKEAIAVLELHQLRTENKKINLKLDEALKDIDRVNRVFEKQPEIQKIFFEAEKALTRNSRGFQMER